MMLSRTGWGETSLPVAFQTVGGRRAPWGCAAGAPYRGTASPPPPPVSMHVSCACLRVFACVCVCIGIFVCVCVLVSWCLGVSSSLPKFLLPNCWFLQEKNSISRLRGARSSVDCIAQGTIRGRALVQRV